MIDKNQAAAVPGCGRLSEKQIIELKELAKTRGEEIQKRLRSESSSAKSDAFNDPAFIKAKSNSREIERQIKLSFSDSQESEELMQSQTESVSWSCAQCSCKDTQRIVHAGGWYRACSTCYTRVSNDDLAQLEHANKLPHDRVYDVQMRYYNEVRPIAKRRGIQLLFENFRCDACNSTYIRREFESNCWSWKCADCGEFKSAVLALKEMKDIAKSKPTLKVETKAEIDAGVEIFNLDDITAAAENASLLSSDEHAKARLKATLTRLLETGTVRPYVVPQNVWQGQLDELRENFPNFIDAIDEVLEPSFAIAAAGGRCRPAPLLLVGPPGVGKSYFSSLIAGVLKTPMFKVDLACATAGSSLDGLATHWSNSCPGEVFKALAFGRSGIAATACPVGFLDEIDKVASGHKYDPIGGLYSLLEVESARNFEDQSLPGIRIDASHVRWIACANTLDTIPKPILSRFHIVHVQAPSAAENQRMFEKIFECVVRDTRLYEFSSQISRSLISHAVEKFSAREFKTRAVMAIGRALARDRYFVEAKDFGTAKVPAARKMGF